MDQSAILRWTISNARELLRDARPTDETSNRLCIIRLRQFIGLRIVQEALSGSDTFLAFVVRRIAGVARDERLSEREMIQTLLTLFREPDVSAALGAGVQKQTQPFRPTPPL